MQYYQADTYQAQDSIGYLIKRAHLLLVDRLEMVIEGSGLTFTQWVVLMYLRDGLALNATTLCAKLRHDSGALTRVLDQLEMRGLVARERSREDRRAVALRLTDAGLAVVESLVPRVVEALNFALRGFSRAETLQMIHLLGRLISNCEVAEQAEARP
jgi:DNA-binding MarR family transcriptional regulator